MIGIKCKDGIVTGTFAFARLAVVSGLDFGVLIVFGLLLTRVWRSS